MLQTSDFHQNLSTVFANPTYVSQRMSTLISEGKYAVTEWLEESLMEGLPGIAAYLLASESHEDAIWEYLVRSYEIQTKEKPTTFSYWYGLPGLTAVVAQASKEISDLVPLKNNLDDILLLHLPKQYLIPGNNLLQKDIFIPTHYYSFAHGVSGILKYLLSDNIPSPFYSLAQKLIEQLSKIVLKKQKHHPFYISPENLPAHQRVHNKKGGVYLSLPLGIAGPLSSLSYASINGIHTPHQQRAIQTLANQVKGWIKNRAEFVIIIPENEPPIHPQPHSFDSYSTGWPNIIRSLFLAGKALQDEKLIQFAASTYTSYFDEAILDPSLQGINFSAGIAGFASISKKMFEDLQMHNKVQQANTLLHRINDHFDPTIPFRFKVHFPLKKGIQRLCQAPGILHGSSGIGLAMKDRTDLLFF